LTETSKLPFTRRRIQGRTTEYSERIIANYKNSTC